MTVSNLAPLQALTMLLLLTVCVEQSCQATKYCVTPQGNGTSDCRRLDDYVQDQDSFSWSDAVFVFEEGVHNYSYEMTIHNQENLMLVGIAAGDVTVECHNGMGFVFKNVSNLTIENLTFVSCGQAFWWNNINYTAALAFLSGHTLSITWVTIEFPTLGGMHTEDVRGPIVVTNSNFKNGRPTHHQELAGSRFAFTKCYYPEQSKQESSLTITGTNFISNSAQPKTMKECHRKKSILAGAMVLMIKCPRVSVSMDHVQFVNNSGCFGGALTVDLKTREIFQRSISITNSIFTGNHGRYGGAAIIDIIYDCNVTSINRTQNMDNILEIKHTDFSNNSAAYDGGALYIRHKESNKLCTAGTVRITHCNFTMNSLQYHGGVVIYNVNFIAYSVIPHIMPQFYIVLDHCRLEGNYVQSNKWNNSGSGAIVTKSNPHLCIVNSSIVHNNCSGIVAISSNLIFKGAVELSGNMASSGGGLVLCSGAIMYFSADSELHITNNRARHAGGGILVEYNCRQAKPICFFQHLPYNKTTSSSSSSTHGATVYMSGNRANYSGDNLYGGSIDNCLILINADTPTVRSSKVFDELFVIDNLNRSITSIPTRACFCNGNETHCNKRDQTFTVAPGSTITTGLVLVGQRNSPTPGNLEAKIHNKNLEFDHHKDKMVFGIGRECKELTFTVESGCMNCTKQEIELFVSTTSDISFTEHLEEYQSIYIHVNLENCPFGFTFCSKQCDCTYLQQHQISCNSSTQTFHLADNGRAWLGTFTNKRNVTYLAVSDNCPQDFCTLPSTILSQNDSLVDPDQQCTGNRTGILCGECKPGYSLILGGNECVESCSNKTVSLVVLFLVLGLLLVFILTALDLTLAEGTICGILFYANVVQINSDLYFHSKVPNRQKLAMFLKVFIAWLNLDFGIPTCFYNGMDSYGKAWLQYAFPLYIWVIAGTIIYLSKKNIRIAALFRSNCVKVLSTLILLSYAKLTRLTMQIFRFHKIYLYQEGSTGGKTYHLKWAFDGKMFYYSRDHLPLFIAGVVTLTVLLPYTFCLLFIRLLYRHSSRRPLWWINKWRPFFDTCIGAYTSSGYCWTGLQLLARILVYAANEAQSEVMFSSLVTLAIVVVLLVIAWWVEPKIYKRKGLNMLEGTMLLNLAILQGATVWYVHMDSFHENFVAYLSTFLTMLLFVGVVCYHIYRQLFSLSYFKARCGAKQWISRTTATPSENKEAIAQAHLENIMPPVTRFHHDREPLLAEDD